MERWILITLLLCAYGYFKELRPSEPFLTPFLKGPTFKNLTENEVNNQIYPVSTYSTLVWLFLVLLTSDLLRQRPILVVGGLAYVGTWVLLIWTYGVFNMQMMQLVYGLAVASEISYFSYVYLIVDPDHYRKATSIARVAVLLGRFSSGVLSQLLVSLHAMNYLQLNYISLTSVSLALVLSLFMPKPRKINLNPMFDGDSSDSDIESTRQLLREEDRNCCGCLQTIKDQVVAIGQALKQAYSNCELLKWSLWWAFATCGYYQVGNYGQNLWDEISPAREDKKIYNGAVEAVSTLAAAVLAFLVGFVPVDWSRFGELLLSVVCLVSGVCLLVFSQTHQLWMGYLMYLLFRALYQPGITVAYFQIARYPSMERYGLIFGTNSLMALLLETVGTAIVVDKRGLNLPVRTQFVIYGLYFSTIGVIFLVAAILTLSTCCPRRPTPPESLTSSVATSRQRQTSSPPESLTSSVAT